jgi:hypothetical protein
MAAEEAAAAIGRLFQSAQRRRLYLSKLTIRTPENANFNAA